MDEQTKAKFIALAALPLAGLTLTDVCFLVTTIAEHTDEATSLIPGLASVLEL